MRDNSSHSPMVLAWMGRRWVPGAIYEPSTFRRKNLKGLRVWHDDFLLKPGESLQSIDRGLARSRFGVVILSSRFFEKHWPQQELNGLATREVGGEKVILPVVQALG